MRKNNDNILFSANGSPKTLTTISVLKNNTYGDFVILVKI